MNESAILSRAGADRVPFHVPSKEAVAASQMTAFMRYCEAETGLRLDDSASLHRFSVEQLRRFWLLFVRWSGVIAEGRPEPVCVGDSCEAASFFPDLRLSYVENLLRIDTQLGPDLPAITSCYPSGRRERLTRGELRRRVANLARRLEALGIEPGDRIVSVAFNDASAVIGGLGAVAVGATLSTCSPDMGAYSILERFAQLEPTILMCHLRNVDSESSISLSDRIAEVVRGLPTLEAIVVLDDGPVPPDLGVAVHSLAELGEDSEDEAGVTSWRRFRFDDPLFVLFSSGTTGKPKCIVHSAGGTLLEHLKEHRLHGDLRPEDKLFFHTSCSWMMWNWQLSALAVGAEIVSFAGGMRGPDTLWRLVSDERVTVFGTSPAYLQMCEDAGFSPARDSPVDRLRAILSTGSILDDHQYDWVANHVGPIPVQSISGGTDILGCFVLGNPNLPVFRGESQCRSLGMDVQAFADDGTIVTGAIGELVCRNPFPSRPLGFYGDRTPTRFHDAYFRQNPGVWTHGDRIEIGREGTVRIHGRSDSVLNVRGVRIGPAEIYRILQSVPEIRECLAVPQRDAHAAGHGRLVLLVVLRGSSTLDGALRQKIRRELGNRGSAAHVPELILAVTHLPTTHSGKRSERAAADVLSGIGVANVTSLRNPESLAEIERALRREGSERTETPGEATPPREEEPLERSVRSAWEHVFGVAPLARDRDFFDLGGTSILALNLCNAIGESTGCALPPSIVFDAPTIAQMVAAIQDRPTHAFSSLVPMKSTGSRNPLFIVHGLDGDVLELTTLARRLVGDRPVFGLRAPGLDPRRRANVTVEEAAEDYLRCVRDAQPKGPYSFAGYSFGGLVAYEMARRIRERGEQVEFVGLLDTFVHDACLGRLARFAFRVRRKVHRASSFVRAERLRPMDEEGFLGRVERLVHVAPDDSASVPIEPMTSMRARIEELAWRAFRTYRPRPYGGPVTFFRAGSRPHDYCDPIPVWAAATDGRLTVCDVPGDHFSMIREPFVTELARRMIDCADRRPRR